MRSAMVALFFCLLVVSGCSRGNLGAVSGSAGSGGILYVSTATAIQHYNSAFTDNGNVAPSVTISGAATSLAAPARLLLDAPSDRLFVANPGSSSILIFETASSRSGNSAPTRVVSGASTLLSAPSDLALDTVNNTLYVADGTRILVFISASTVAGNIPPVHNISLGFSVGGILLDTTGNRLYVADPAGNAIDRLEGAGAQDGPAIITATISGLSTGLLQPNGLALDSTGRLFVSNASAPSITIYTNPAIVSGNISPAATISGPLTQLGSPGQLVVNNNGTGELYVADAFTGGVLIFSGLPGLSGNVPPTRSIVGPLTGLAASTVNGLALDTTR